MIAISALARRGILRARPQHVLEQPAPAPGVHPLRAGARGGALVVPRSADASRLAPLIVFLHGAGGSASHGLELLRPGAEKRGTLLLVPESIGPTWDFFDGADVGPLDAALEDTFTRFAIDPTRVIVSGFSDGASYALSLGLTNEELFTHVLAFSPGFGAQKEAHGTPRIFISHGRNDRVLPIDRCSRVLATRLERAGYEVHFHEFDGEHVVPAAILDEAFTWATTPQP